MNIQEITPRHLQRLACLYVRQSTLQQVLENRESTARQYALRERATALGWSNEQIVVLDQDLGHSAASAVDRAGFQHLVAQVGLGKVGLVLGLEVSRLARSSSDWHHLLEICALTGTLILDEDGLYDPAKFNDRLLLGLKGTMSEAELYILRARLQGAILNKARRAELKLHLPIGFCYTEDNHIVLDPDLQVRETVKLVLLPFGAPVQPVPPFGIFVTSKFLFLVIYAAVPIKANWSGIVLSTMMSYVFCIIRFTLEPLSLVVLAPQKALMAKFTSLMYPARSGKWSKRRYMWVTLPG